MRDAKPIARLVRIDVAGSVRQRFDPVAHAKWQRKTAGGKVSRRVDRMITEGRRDRRRPSATS